MILKTVVLYATPRSRACMQLYEQHRSERSVLQLLDKTRTRRRKWLRELHSVYHPKYLEMISHTPSKSSSTNTLPTYTTNHQVAVTCQRGHDRASFCGTQYRVANQVFLFLTTGMSGDTLQKKSSTDLMKEVALSSYFSAVLRVASQVRSMKPQTESSEPATPAREEYGQAKPHSPAQDYLRRSTPGYLSFPKDQ